MKALLVYMPVLHQGYLDFFEKYSDADTIFLFGKDLTDQFDHLRRKDIRAVDPLYMRNAVARLFLERHISVLSKHEIPRIRPMYSELVFADEVESRQVASKYFSGCQVSFDRVFLRWDKQTSTEQKIPSAFPVTLDEFHLRFLDEAEEISKHSPDWWRQVGAILVSGDKKIVAYNEHLPSDHATYAFGDPRSFFKKGIGVELTLALHAEAAVVGKALCEGVISKGARLYVTTFPCPFCANVLSQTGISELYFRSGYSMLDGAKLLQDVGIKIYQVIDATTSE